MNLKKTVDGGKTLLKNWWNEIVENNFTTIQNTFNAHEAETEETAAILTDIKEGKATITGTEKKGTVQLVSAGNSKISSDIQTITFCCGASSGIQYGAGTVWIESISGQWTDGSDINFSTKTFEEISTDEALVSLYLYVKSISEDNKVTVGLGIIDLLNEPITPVIPDEDGGESETFNPQEFFRLKDEQIIIGTGEDCKSHTYTKEAEYRAKLIAISDGEGKVKFFDVEQAAGIQALEVKKQLSEQITAETEARKAEDISLREKIINKIGFEESNLVLYPDGYINWDEMLEPKIYSVYNEGHIPAGLPKENGQGIMFVLRTDLEIMPGDSFNTVTPDMPYYKYTVSQIYISGNDIYYRKTGAFYYQDGTTGQMIDDSPYGTEPQWSAWSKPASVTGDLTELNTADKSSIVGAINELQTLKADAINNYGGFNSGKYSYANRGGAIGYNAATGHGAAVGENAKTSNGAALGQNAKTADENANAIDAIQLGTGTNNTPKTMQVYNKRIVEADGSLTDVGNLFNLAEMVDKTNLVEAINSLCEQVTACQQQIISVQMQIAELKADS